jgi:hypothetical protein
MLVVLIPNAILNEKLISLSFEEYDTRIQPLFTWPKGKQQVQDDMHPSRLLIVTTLQADTAADVLTT